MSLCVHSVRLLRNLGGAMSLVTPKLYPMVDLDGLDLAEVDGTRAPGIYNKISSNLTQDNIEIFYNWYFANIILAPYRVSIDTTTPNQFLINGVILVKSDDTISITGHIYIPVIESLSVTENGTYNVPSGIDGYGPVVVDVPTIPPVLVELNVDENGTYLPDTGQDGFSKVIVDVPIPVPVLETLSVDTNGTYNPGEGVDGFSQVVVNVPQPVPLYPYVTPDYMGLSYAYIAINGGFYANDANTACIGYFPVTPGTYVGFAGNNISNRLRIHYYSDKTYSDFEAYAINPHTNTDVYWCTENITGQSDLSGNDLLRRFFFTVSQAGEVLIATSNVSVVNPPFLFKIS